MLSERLKKSRERLNLTQLIVASELGVEVGTLSGYERGYRKPSPEVIAKLSEIYQVSSDYLLGLTDDPRPYIGNSEDVLAAHKENPFADVTDEEARMIEAVLAAYRSDPKNKKN